MCQQELLKLTSEIFAYVKNKLKIKYSRIMNKIWLNFITFISNEKIITFEHFEILKMW